MPRLRRHFAQGCISDGALRPVGGGALFQQLLTGSSLPRQVKRDKVTRLVILPLYPQFSISTSGSSLRLIQEIFEQDKDLKDLKHTVIPSWYQRPGYVTAMADLIQRQLTSFPHAPSVQLFFSAHGVPLSYVEEAGDPYREEMQECIKLIMQELQRRGINNPHTLAYQSRVGPVSYAADDSGMHWHQASSRHLPDNLYASTKAHKVLRTTTDVARHPVKSTAVHSHHDYDWSITLFVMCLQLLD